jgi:hypothetical protein
MADVYSNPNDESTDSVPSGRMYFEQMHWTRIKSLAKSAL